MTGTHQVRRGSLLIVDNEEEILQALKRQFRKQYHVYLAKSADEGLRIIGEEPIQVIISDQRMRGMSGTEFFKYVNTKFPEAIRLILTAYADIDAVIAAINDGHVFRYIMKPWGPEELKMIVQQAFQQYWMIRGNRELMHTLQKTNTTLIQEVAECKATEAALQESEVKLQGFVESAPDAIFVINSDGDIILLNAQAEKMFGYARDIILGQQVEILLPERFRLKHVKHRQTYLSNPASREMGTSLELYGRHKDGYEFPIDVMLSPLETRQGLLVLSAIRDITERKEVEGTLQQRIREMSALNTLSQQVSANLSLDQVIQAAIEGISTTVSPDLAMLFLRQEDTLILKNFLPKNSHFQHDTIPAHCVGQCLCGLAVSKAQPIYSKNIHQDERCTWQECKQAGMQSFAALPLWSGQEVIGVLGMASEIEEYDFESQANFLEILANEISTGLQNAILFEKANIHSAELAQINEELKTQIIERQKVEEELREHREQLEDLVNARTDTLQQEIAERKRTLQALEESNKNFEAVFNATMEAFIITTLQGNIINANPQASILYGYSQEEFSQINVTQLIRPDDHPVFRQFFNDISTTGNAHVQTTDVKKDGTTFYTDITGAILEYSGERHLLAVIRDITSDKKRETGLRQAKSAADLANQAKSEFLANMSHELRTPLNGILGYTQILRRDANLTEQQQRGLEIIQRSGEHLLMMINDILDLSKIEARKMSLNSAAFNLINMLKDIVAMVRIRSGKQGVRFAYEKISDIPLGVFGDEKCLRQVLLNLLDNAIKFTEQGEVVLKVGESPQKDGIHSQSRTHFLRFQVEDTGIGISSEHLEMIFSPFHQAHRQKIQAEGTGLGLSISQQLVEMMGGRLQVKSTVGQGSTFWFDISLPASALPNKKNDEKSPQIIGYHGERRTILVVDDKPINREVLKELMTPLGFNVVEAANGHEALDKAQAFRPDLIVLDLVMPDMDGFETARQIRKLEGRIAQWGVRGTQSPNLMLTNYSQPIIIALSASAFHQTRETSLAAGCNAFLAKPFRDEDLLELLRSHLGFEWIIENVSEGHDAETPLEESTMIPPSAEELAMLQKLAIIGDIAGLQKWIQEMETSEPTLSPFVDKLLQLTNEFQIIKVQEFIESCMQ